jgi:hypothetical protein
LLAALALIGYLVIMNVLVPGAVDGLIDEFRSQTR